MLTAFNVDNGLMPVSVWRGRELDLRVANEDTVGI
jgi:hypothetical protein